MTAEALLSRLDRVRRTGQSRWSACCPAHADKSPSLSVREEDDGRLLVRCFAGCSVPEVLNALGLDWSALYPPRPIDHGRPIRKPWRASDVVRALEFELDVAYLILSDIHKGREVNDVDRQRAGDACARIGRFAEELRNAA